MIHILVPVHAFVIIGCNGSIASLGKLSNGRWDGAYPSHRSESDIKVQVEFVWMRAQADRIYFASTFVLQPDFDHVGSEDISL